MLELGIVQKLRDECFKQARPLTLAFSSFPRPMQPQLDLYEDGRYGLNIFELDALVYDTATDDSYILHHK